MINKLKRITSSPHGPYKLGYSCATIVINKVMQYIKNKMEQITKILFQFGLMTETRHYKDGITSNRKSERYGELVSRPCTHRPSHAGK